MTLSTFAVLAPVYSRLPADPCSGTSTTALRAAGWLVPAGIISGGSEPFAGKSAINVKGNNATAWVGKHFTSPRPKNSLADSEIHLTLALFSSGYPYMRADRASERAS